MRTYLLKPQHDLLPRAGDDDGRRVLKVWTKPSAMFIQAACARRGLWSATATVDGAFETTIRCNKEQLEEVREEFNSRPRG